MSDRAELIENWQPRPGDDLFEPDRFDWTEGNPFVTWIINNTYSHYAEHIGDLKAWLTANP